jgi:hypothetical protein
MILDDKDKFCNGDSRRFWILVSLSTLVSDFGSEMRVKSGIDEIAGGWISSPTLH